MTTEDAIGVLRKEIEIMKSRQAISDAALEHIREIKKICFIEGSYDPYNQKSYEAAHMIRPHIDALCLELHL